MSLCTKEYLAALCRSFQNGGESQYRHKYSIFPTLGLPRKTPNFGNSPESRAVAVRFGVTHVLIDWEEHSFIGNCYLDGYGIS